MNYILIACAILGGISGFIKIYEYIMPLRIKINRSCGKLVYLNNDITGDKRKWGIFQLKGHVLSNKEITILNMKLFMWIDGKKINFTRLNSVNNEWLFSGGFSEGFNKIHLGPNRASEFECFFSLSGENADNYSDYLFDNQFIPMWVNVEYVSSGKTKWSKDMMVKTLVYPGEIITGEVSIPKLSMK